MWNRKLIKHLEDEILFLRSQLKETQDRFMAFNEGAFYKFQARDQMKAPVPPPSSMNLSGEIESMEAKTDEEKEQKKAALEEIRQLLG